MSLYSILVYCNKESLSLFNFHMNLLYSNKIRTIIQATKNTIVLESIAEYENQENAKQFHMSLSKKLGLELGHVLGSLLLTSEVKGMEDKGWPFLTNIDNTSLPGKFPLSPLTYIFPQSHF